jgi:hypothetical protein
MTSKLTIKPIIKAGVFALVVGGVFAALAKYNKRGKTNRKITPTGYRGVAERFDTDKVSEFDIGFTQ